MVCRSWVMVRCVQCTIDCGQLSIMVVELEDDVYVEQTAMAR